MFLDFIYVFGPFLIIVLLGERWVRKKYNIPKREGWIQIHKALHPMQSWIEVGMFVVIFGLGIIMELVYGFRTNLVLNYIIPLYCYRCYTEWKYKKDEREYIVTIYTVAMLIVLYIMLSLVF